MPGNRNICTNNNSVCNLPCERLFLQHNITLADDGMADLSFIATNVSGRRIRGPVLLVSSLLGNLMFAPEGFESGETKKLSKIYKIQVEDYQQKYVSNVSFLAVGVPTSVPNQYTPGERLSSPVNERLATSTILDVNGKISVNGDQTTLTVNLQSWSQNNIISFATNLDRIIRSGSTPVIQSGGDIFSISGSTLTLKQGQIIPPRGFKSVTVLIDYNNRCEISCILQYNVGDGTRGEIAQFFVSSGF